jgi:glycosyltransferase involved in cell wall biosynthesis
VESISEAMEKLAQDYSLQKQLSIEGMKRSQQFNWDDSATHVWNILIKTLNQA